MVEPLHILHVEDRRLQQCIQLGIKFRIVPAEVYQCSMTISCNVPSTSLVPRPSHVRRFAVQNNSLRRQMREGLGTRLGVNPIQYDTQKWKSCVSVYYECKLKTKTTRRPGNETNTM